MKNFKKNINFLFEVLYLLIILLFLKSKITLFKKFIEKNIIRIKKK